MGGMGKTYRVMQMQVKKMLVVKDQSEEVSERWDAYYRTHRLEHAGGEE
jgi:hypothetical protein